MKNSIFCAVIFDREIMQLFKILREHLILVDVFCNTISHDLTLSLSAPIKILDKMGSDLDV